MLYDPATDPLWGEIKVVNHTPRAACRAGLRDACVLQRHVPPLTRPPPGIKPPGATAVLLPVVQDDLTRVGCAQIEGMHDVCVFQVNERP